MKAEDKYPLAGLVVLDMGQIFAGSYAGFLFAMAGATVIKVEPPRGDVLRTRIAFRGVGGFLPFAMLNSNKYGIVVNLKEPKGRELLLDLVRRADVLLENFGPDTLERLGLGWEVLHETNPRLVYGSISGYGREGPYRNYPAMDLTIQAMSGVMSVTGYPDRPPVKAGPAIADFNGGIHLYAAITTALIQRSKTGEGSHVEVALQDAVYPSLASSLGLFARSGASSRTGNQHAGLAQSPYNVYETKDGYLAILCISEQHWRSLVEVMGRPDLQTDPRFQTMKDRVRNMELVDELIAGWLIDLERDDAFSRLIEANVPVAPVRELAEVTRDEQMHATGMLEWFEDPEYGSMVLPNSPLRFREQDRVARRPPPKLGEHTEMVLKDLLGLDVDEVQRLAEGGVVA